MYCSLSRWVLVIVLLVAFCILGASLLVAFTSGVGFDSSVGKADDAASPKLVLPAAVSPPLVTSCFVPTSIFPLSPLEQELRRLWTLTEQVAAQLNVTVWPTDGTLLGLMRNGRIATDRDIDVQIHSTYDGCAPMLRRLKGAFATLARIKSFHVAMAKWNGKKIGRYAMVRLFREFGTFDTGVDFNCVYMDDPASPKFYTHRGVLTSMPLAVYPLGRCRLYDKDVACPRDGYAVLEALKPRYVGCMVFPHCLGDPTASVRKCLSPHPLVPLQSFFEWTRALEVCGYTSLAEHARSEKECEVILRKNELQCEQIEGHKFCFLQRFDG